MTIGAGNTLTIGTVDSSVTLGATYTLQNSGSITVAAGSGAHTIAANVALGADQTWGNVSWNNLTVSGAIGGAHNLAFAGSYTVYNPGTFTPSAGPTKPRSPRRLRPSRVPAADSCSRGHRTTRARRRSTA